MNTFLQKLLGFGKKAAVDFFHVLLNFVKSDAVKNLISTELGLIAQEVVGQFSTDAFATLTGEEKRQQAFTAISGKAEQAGISFTDSVIHLLIEVCVQNLKTLGQ